MRKRLSSLAECVCGQGVLYVGRVFLQGGTDEERSLKATLCNRCTIVSDPPEPACNCIEDCIC